MLQNRLSALIVVALVTYQYPSRNLLANEGHNKGLDKHGIEKEAYEAQGDFSDVEDDLRAIGTHLHVVRCLYTVSRDED